MKVQGKNFYSLELKAIDNLTLEHIECTCPILGAWQGSLIVEYNGKSRAVGESEVNHNSRVDKRRTITRDHAASEYEWPIIALAGG